jgi:hypothetical protein
MGGGVAIWFLRGAASLNKNDWEYLGGHPFSSRIPVTIHNNTKSVKENFANFFDKCMKKNDISCFKLLTKTSSTTFTGFSTNR